MLTVSSPLMTWSRHTGSSNRPSRIMEPEGSTAALILGPSLALALEMLVPARSRTRTHEYICVLQATETRRRFRSRHMLSVSAHPEGEFSETNERVAGHR